MLFVGVPEVEGTLKALGYGHVQGAAPGCRRYHERGGNVGDVHGRQHFGGLGLAVLAGHKAHNQVNYALGQAGGFDDRGQSGADDDGYRRGAGEGFQGGRERGGHGVAALHGARKIGCGEGLENYEDQAGGRERHAPANPDVHYGYGDADHALALYRQLCASHEEHCDDTEHESQQEVQQVLIAF